MTCGTCGKDGGHGFRGLSRCPFETGSGHAVKQDTIEGGFLAENAFREPRWFDSQKAYEKALDAEGLMLKPKKSKGADPVSPETLVWAAQRVAARTKHYPVTTRILEGEKIVVPMEVE
jgi:hypothetical protein